MEILSEYNSISKRMHCFMLLNKTIAEQSWELKRNWEASVPMQMKLPVLVWQGQGVTATLLFNISSYLGILFLLFFGLWLRSCQSPPLQIRFTKQRSPGLGSDKAVLNQMAWPKRLTCLLLSICLTFPFQFLSPIKHFRDNTSPMFMMATQQYSAWLFSVLLLHGQ